MSMAVATANETAGTALAASELVPSIRQPLVIECDLPHPVRRFSV